MENALSTIKLLPATKAELKIYTEKVKAEVLNGYYNPLEVAGMFKAMEELIKSLRSDYEIKEAIQQEADKYKEKTIDFGNYKISKQERKTKDYTGIDTVLDELIASQERTKQMIEARKAVIDAGVNPETGETFSPVPFATNYIVSVSLK